MIDHGLAQLEEVRAPETGTLEDAYIRVNKQMVLEKGKDIIGKSVLSISLENPLSCLYLSVLTDHIRGRIKCG